MIRFSRIPPVREKFIRFRISPHPENGKRGKGKKDRLTICTPDLNVLGTALVLYYWCSYFQIHYTFPVVSSLYAGYRVYRDNSTINGDLTDTDLKNRVLFLSRDRQIR